MIHIHWTNVTTDYCPKRGETTWALVTHLFSNTPGLLCSDVTGLCFEGGTFGQHSPVCLCFWETFSPFDCAFEVWLADGAVVYEDGWTGAVFLWEWTRGHLHTFKKTKKYNTQLTGVQGTHASYISNFLKVLCYNCFVLTIFVDHLCLNVFLAESDSFTGNKRKWSPLQYEMYKLIAHKLSS